MSALQNRRGGSKTLMGYPVDNKIDKETQLYVYIGPNAIEEKRESLFNRYFQEHNINAKLMPLNIREDDLGFFIHNFKNSKIKAAYCAQEYWDKVASLLQSIGVVSSDTSLIDTLHITQNSYAANFLFPLAVKKSIVQKNPIHDKTVAIIGSSPLALSVIETLKLEKPKIFALYDQIIEYLLPLEESAEPIPCDINRLDTNDISRDYDIIINCTEKPVNITSQTVTCFVNLQNRNYAVPNALYHIEYNTIFDTITQIITKEWITNG